MTMIHHILKAVAASVIITIWAVNSRAITPTEAFVSAPTDVIPLLDSLTRLDMIDYFNAGSDHESVNLLYGSSSLKQITPNLIEVETTGASLLDIVVLPAGQDTLLAVISTVMTPVPDSQVKLYSSSWEPMNDKAFSLPPMKQWLAKGSDLKKVDRLLPLMLVSCTFDPATLSFVFTNNTEKYMGVEEYAPLKPLLRDYLVYAFEPRKRAITFLGYDAANPLKP